MSNRSPSPEVLELADAMERLLEAQLRRVADVPSRSEYTSKDLPPGMSQRAFRDRCKELAAREDDRVRRRGRMWVAARDAIDEKPVRARPKLVAGPWTPEAALRSIGRRQRGPKRTEMNDGNAQ